MGEEVCSVGYLSNSWQGAEIRVILEWKEIKGWYVGVG